MAAPPTDLAAPARTHASGRSRPWSCRCAPGSPAAAAGIAVGDEIVRVNGVVPRDIIEWQMAADDAEIDLDVGRGGLELSFSIEKAAGESLGVEVSSAVFDRVRTCDNHCEFCFIYQLPKGMRTEPLPEGRRLPPVVPLRELHHAHPVHRGRPRTGDHRAVVAAAREHPRHRPRRAQPDAEEPAGRDEPAVAAGAARPRHHRPRPDRGVPRRQRRGGPRRHVRRHPRSVSRARLGGRRAARHLQVQR